MQPAYDRTKRLYLWLSYIGWAGVSSLSLRGPSNGNVGSLFNPSFHPSR